MTNDLIFITQIASVLAYIGTLFILYRVLVGQKDATIEALKQKIALQEERLSITRESKPDVLLNGYRNRVELLTAELARLEQERDPNKEAVMLKQQELDSAKQQLSLANKKVDIFYNMIVQLLTNSLQSPTEAANDKKG